MYGYHLCKFLGVLVRWIFINLISLFFSKKKFVNFMEVWKGNNIKAPITGMTNEMASGIIGILFLIGLCFMLYYCR